MFSYYEFMTRDKLQLTEFDTRCLAVNDVSPRRRCCYGRRLTCCRASFDESSMSFYSVDVPFSRRYDRSAGPAGLQVSGVDIVVGRQRQRNMKRAGRAEDTGFDARMRLRV